MDVGRSSLDAPSPARHIFQQLALHRPAPDVPDVEEFFTLRLP